MATPAQSPHENGQKPTPAELLLEQYKLLEDRRKYFGAQFMQTAGGVAVIVSILVGVLGSRNERRLFSAVGVAFAGVALILLAFLSYRLAKRQDACESAMAQIERWLKEIGYEKIVNMPPGAKTFGARQAIETVLLIFGTALLALGVYLVFGNG